MVGLLTPQGSETNWSSFDGIFLFHGDCFHVSYKMFSETLMSSFSPHFVPVAYAFTVAPSCSPLNVPSGRLFMVAVSLLEAKMN